MSPIFALLWGDIAREGEVSASLDRAGRLALESQASQHRLRPLLFQRASDGAWNVPAELLHTWPAGYQRSVLRALTEQAALAPIGQAF